MRQRSRFLWTRAWKKTRGRRRRGDSERDSARAEERESASPSFSPSLSLARSSAVTPPSIDPLPVPPGPGPLHRVGLGRDEREVAEVQAREEVDDGAPGSLEEVEDHLCSIGNEKLSLFSRGSLALFCGRAAAEPASQLGLNATRARRDRNEGREALRETLEEARKMSNFNRFEKKWRVSSFFFFRCSLFLQRRRRKKKNKSNRKAGFHAFGWGHSR